MTGTVDRRIAGTAALVIVIALAAIGFELRFARPDGSTDFQIATSEIGLGTQPGTDIKIRGVPVGRVVAVGLQDGRAVITGRLRPGVQVPKEDLEVTISPKTFFGEKQIDLSFPLDTFGQPPFLEDGDVVDISDGVTEVEEVLQTLQPLIGGIDENDLAILFDAVAELEGEGEVIARALDVSAELSRFSVSITDDALHNARLLTSLSNQLATGAEDFDRLNRALPPALAILSERTQEIDTTLEALSSFSLATASWLNVERDRFDRVMATGDLVGAFLERNVESIPSIIEGIRMFADAQSFQGPETTLEDGSIYVPFKVFFDPEDLQPILDGLLGELTGGGAG